MVRFEIGDENLSFTTNSTMAQDRSKAFFRDIKDSLMSFKWRTCLVEVAFFFYFLARHMSVPLFQEYIQAETLKNTIAKNKQLVSTGAKTVSNSTIVADLHDSTEAQQQSAITVLALLVAEGLPAVIMVVLLGAVSDRMGKRKVLLWLPSLGMVCYAFVYVMTVYTGWSLDGLFMAAALRGLTGSMPAFLAGATFFAVNSVDEDYRASRLAVQEFLNGFTFALGNIIVGYWVRDSGFAVPFWFVTGCSLVAFIVSLFGVEEVTPPDSFGSDTNCCSRMFNPILKLFRCKERTSLRIWLAIMAFQCFSFIALGQEITTVLYLLGAPHSWSPVNIGVYLFVMMGLSAIGALLGTYLLGRYLNLSENSLCMAGYLSKALGMMWFGVVMNDGLKYITTILLVLQLVPMPMLRSIVSRQAPTTDHGSLFALMHCGQGITFFLAPLVFTAIYSATLHYFTGFVFIAGVIMLILPTAFTIAIRVFEDDKGPRGIYKRMGQPDGQSLELMAESAVSTPTDSLNTPVDFGHTSVLSINTSGEENMETISSTVHTSHDH